jgi:hypothetical protein
MSAFTDISNNNFHLRFSRSLEGYFFFKSNISAYFNFSLTRNVDSICL